MRVFRLLLRPRALPTTLVGGVHDGLDGQHGAHQCRGGGHATALFQIVQVVHREPVADVELVFLHPVPQLVQGQVLLQLLVGGQVHQQALAQGGAEGVDDPDAALGMLGQNGLRRDAGGLVGGGQGRGEADAQDILPLLQNGGHGVLKLAHVDGGGGGHFARPDPPVKLLVADGRAIQGVGIVLPVHVHGQGQHLQLQVLCHLVRQVAAAVGHENIFAHGKNLLGRYSFRVFSTSNIPY